MINDLWYKNAVIYCLSVATYMDANGDGRGDFQGLMRRLDYLQGMGVTAIWLMPFQPSPGKDDGYDVADYYGVDPRYGTLGDFVEFTHGCKQRGLRVLIDLVVNHTLMNIRGSKLHVAIHNPSIAIGMYGQRRNRKMPLQV
jgi:maltose alpha-D-glucosyltransferase / alpha-amylase